MKNPSNFKYWILNTVINKYPFTVCYKITLLLKTLKLQIRDIYIYMVYIYPSINIGIFYIWGMANSNYLWKTRPGGVLGSWGELLLFS